MTGKGMLGAQPTYPGFTMYSVDELDTVVELRDLPQSSVGAPCPVVLAGEHRLSVAFLLEARPPDWDGTTVRVVGPDTPGEPAAVVRFVGPLASMFGPPDEAFDGHPLARRGLRPYGAFEVRRSSWIRALERMNSVHPDHRPEHFDAFRHFVLAFHDTTFECVAMGCSYELTSGPLDEVMARGYEAERYGGYAELCARMAMGELNELAGVILRALLEDKDFSGSAECKPFLGRARACCKWALPYAVTLRLDIQFGGAPPYIPVSKPPDKTEWIPLTAEPRPDWLVVLTTSQEDVNHPDVFDTGGWDVTDADAPKNCQDPAETVAVACTRGWASGRNVMVLPVDEGVFAAFVRHACLTDAVVEDLSFGDVPPSDPALIQFRFFDGEVFPCATDCSEPA